MSKKDTSPLGALSLAIHNRPAGFINKISKCTGTEDSLIDSSKECNGAQEHRRHHPSRMGTDLTYSPESLHVGDEVRK